MYFKKYEFIYSNKDKICLQMEQKEQLKHKKKMKIFIFTFVFGLYNAFK